jgi:hypothetical protein
MYRDAIEHSCYLAILMGLGHGPAKVGSRRHSPCASGLSNSKADYQSATQTVAQSASVTIAYPKRVAGPLLNWLEPISKLLGGVDRL